LSTFKHFSIIFIPSSSINAPLSRSPQLAQVNPSHPVQLLSHSFIAPFHWVLVTKRVRHKSHLISISLWRSCQRTSRHNLMEPNPYLPYSVYRCALFACPPVFVIQACIRTLRESRMNTH